MNQRPTEQSIFSISDQFLKEAYFKNNYVY